MRLLLVVIGTLAFLSTTVDAQQWLPAQRSGAGSGLPYAKESGTRIERGIKNEPVDRVYRDAVKGIPDGKKSSDPWRNVR